MDEQRQDDQLEPTYNSSVLIQDVALKRWTIKKDGGRGSGRSVLMARNDDDDNEVYCDLKAQLVGAVEYILTASLQRSKTSSMSVMDMTLKHLMVKLKSWNFGECGVPPHCHYSQIHSDPEWKYLCASN